MIREPLPWQTPLWEGIQHRRSKGRLPHALLLEGPPGVGKRHFAEALAASLLCRGPVEEGVACGGCRACHLLESGAHGDLHRVTVLPRESKPEQLSSQIKVDQVRELCHVMGLTAHEGGYKVALLDPAERMTVEAANSLLKTLEEPPGDVLMMLVTDQPGLLPATIRSRCQRIGFTPPPEEEGRAWLTRRLEDAERAALLLALADGAPLRALEMAESDGAANRLELLEVVESLARGAGDPVSLSAHWYRQAPLEAVGWMESWLEDMIRLHWSDRPALLRNRDVAERLKRMALGYSRRELFLLREETHRAARLLRGGSINAQLLLEDLFTAWGGEETGKGLGGG